MSRESVLGITEAQHRDLQEIRRTLAEMAWAYQRWLFGQAGRIWVPSQPERRTLIARGFDPAKLALIPTGRSLALVAR